MKFWQELRRRRVFRLAGLYVVGAWVLIQVADVSFPAWGLPETAIRYLFVAAVTGFPVALVFGWFYDITSQGIVRTQPMGDAGAIDLRLRRADYVVLAALLAVGVAIVAGSVGKIRKEIDVGSGLTAQMEKLANSIAVLPFTNLDTRPDTGYFSDGITEEILHRLSTMGALHVLASTSSFAFRDSEETPASISDRLGVRYLLQGSVRRDGDYVRITARLLDESGFQVWSDRFDRKLESIFVIQAEIAGTVSSEILNEIVPPQELPEGRTTGNMEAYNAYLRGRAYFDARTTGWKERAEEAFRRAIELDPGYAPPYAGLATLPVNTNVGPRWEEARDLALKSLELDPEFPLGHAVLGMTFAALGENERAVESLRRAIELDPALAIAYTWVTLPLNRLGLHEEARAMEERGLEIDPLSPVLIRNLADNESNRGNANRAETLLLRLAGLPEPPFWVFDSLWELYSDWGRYADAVDAAKNIARLSARDGGNPRVENLAYAYAALGLDEDAEHWMGEFRSHREGIDPPLHASYFLAIQGAAVRGLSADLAKAESLLFAGRVSDMRYVLAYGGLGWIQVGDLGKGVDWLERGIVLYEQDMAPDASPAGIDYELLDANWWTDVVVHLAQRLSYAYDASGNEHGVGEAMTFLEQFRSSVRLPTNPKVFETLAVTRVLAGDTQGALDHLRSAVELGWANYYGIVNDPAWGETLEMPEFAAVLAEARANNERQRAIVEAADAGQDFRTEFERLQALQSQATH